MKLKTIILFLGLVIGSVSYAGGWVVGVGELLGDAINPWFLNNKPLVSYCIVIDEVNFGLSQSRAEEMVTKGLKFWMRQFKESQSFDQDFPVGNLVFTQENCQSSTELKFQFGVLEFRQLQQLQDMDRKIAVSVRTDYDPVNMRGKGFIYISPQQGPLAVFNPRIQSNPWSLANGISAQLILIHELGHVFGLRHDSQISMMQEDFVELTVTPGFLSYNKPEEIENGLDELLLFKIGDSFLAPSFGVCMASEVITEPVGPASVKKKKKRSKNSVYSNHNQILIDFFGLDFQPECIFSKAVFENNQFKAALTFSSSGHSQSIMIVQKSGDFPYIERDSLLKVYLPKEQSVFKDQGSYYRNFGMVEESVSFHSEVLDSKSGKHRPVTVTLSNDHNPIITTEYGGRIYLDILSGI